MKHLFLTTFFLLGMAFALAPSDVQAAGLVPCGLNEGTPAEKAPCTVCHIIIGGNGVIAWGLKIMATIAIVVIFAMGVLYIVSAGDQGLMQKAKGGIWAALIGFAIMLSAWLIVNIVLAVLVDKSKEPFLGLVQNGTFNFSCDTSSNSKYKVQ
ncbi:MAG: hypothetical protein WA082_01550 [Candidatus Moraniibacteriota bacterium]